MFREPWEAQAFAMALALHARGLFTWPEWAATLGDEIKRAQAAGDPDTGETYYRHWLNALERLVAEKGIADARDAGALSATPGTTPPTARRTATRSSSGRKISGNGGDAHCAKRAQLRAAESGTCSLKKRCNNKIGRITDARRSRCGLSPRPPRATHAKRVPQNAPTSCWILMGDVTSSGRGAMTDFAIPVRFDTFLNYYPKVQKILPDTTKGETREAFLIKLQDPFGSLKKELDAWATGNINQNKNYTTCCIQMSHAINMAFHTADPSKMIGRRTRRSDGDSRATHGEKIKAVANMEFHYIASVDEMKGFLEDTFGDGEEISPPAGSKAAMAAHSKSLNSGPAGDSGLHGHFALGGSHGNLDGR